jgi:hypothetical protein
MKHKEREYVQAAGAIGGGHFRKLFLHILPNVTHIVIINTSLQFQFAIKSEVILSYLGLGVQGEPSWGTMIDDAKLELSRGVWWQLAGATTAMFLVVLAFNLLGDALRDSLDPWVREHNEKIIRKAHSEGLLMSEFREYLKKYLESPEVRSYFGNQKIVLFGKSMTAIDLPFLNRDLGWDFMRKYFHHRNLDLSGIGYSLIDLGLLPMGMDSGSNLMNYLNMGEVAHTALEDAKNTAIMYLKLLDKFETKKS